MELMTLAAIAERLRLPESTVRYHAKRFTQFIPTIGDGRQRKYRPESVEILRTVAEMLKHNQTVTEVTEHLKKSYPVNTWVDGEDELSTTTKSQPPTTKQQQSDLPVNLRDFLEMHMEIVKQSIDKDKVIASQQTALEMREKEIASLQAEVERLQRLSWWRRLFLK